jgi:hypothetical protein
MTADSRCEVFDMHGPDEVLVHVPHITAEAMPAQ